MNILFIGNSYTYVHNVPELFEKLAKENEKNITVDSVTKGARKLYENLDPADEKHGEIISLTAQKEYDVLILQEQSYLGITDYQSFEKGVLGLNKLVSPKKTVLYATWGRKEGCPLLQTLGLNSEEMFLALEKAYLQAAKTIQAEISPVGRCFNAITKQYDDIDLYSPDLSHQSYIGSCVAAVCHYKTVFGEMPATYASLELDADVYQRISPIIKDSI
ncbi:MAG: hypothetical protein J6S77_00735 [Clostridia bacterium]|nr:hypothetical protein [Clostridia bacterium]MBO7737209.1 hypothetical protein [Clostridia bacterium]